MTVASSIPLDPDGGVLLDRWQSGDAWARGIKGLFFGPESRFREKLVRSLWK